MQSAPHIPEVAHDRGGNAIDAGRPTVGEMLWEIIDLASGLTIILLPLFPLAIPGVMLFVLLPAVPLLIIAAVPVVAAAAIIAPPYLLIRLVWRRRRTHRESRRAQRALPTQACP